MSNETYFTSGMAIYPDSSWGLGVTTGSSNNYGAWTELVSSTSSDILVSNITVRGSDANARIQIGTGASGSETVRATISTKSLFGYSTSMFVCMNPYLLIPSNSRIAIRVASAIANASYDITLIYIPISNVINPVLSEVSNPTGAVVSDSSNSATSFKTNLTQTTDNFWKDAWCKITSGALAGQVKQITGYNGTTKFITVSGGYTSTPAAGVTFELINQ